MRCCAPHLTSVPSAQVVIAVVSGDTAAVDDIAASSKHDSLCSDSHPLYVLKLPVPTSLDNLPGIDCSSKALCMALSLFATLQYLLGYSKTGTGTMVTRRS